MVGNPRTVMTDVSVWVSRLEIRTCALLRAIPTVVYGVVSALPAN
jgi:hypothetical protein